MAGGADNKGPMESMKIPLNLKNAFRPFVLDPNNSLLKIQEDASAASGTPQMFSFRGSSSRLGILPSSWELNRALGEDISLKLIYGMQSDGQMTSSKVTLEHLLNHIPAVQIREYQQDSKLNQIFSLFGSIKEGFDKGQEAAAAAASSGDLWGSVKNAAGKWWKTFKWIIINPDKFVKELLGGVKLTRDMMIPDTGDKSYLSIIKVPHILYYQMISSLSLNTFELPFSGDFVREASGHGGWNRGRGIQGIGADGGGSWFSKAIGYFGDNIKVSMTPTWDGASDEEGTTIEFTVNLFNDSADQACVNFVLVNTLLPAMMFTQYHIFQQSPSLFDVKVDGLGRFFMCSGSFKVEYKGVVRTPSRKILETLTTKYLNPAYKIDADYLLKSGIAKIPDAYQITLQFKSLLPNSFNNYIYSNCANHAIEKESLYQPSMYGSLVDSFKKTTDAIASKLEKGEEPFKEEEKNDTSSQKSSSSSSSSSGFTEEEIAEGRASYGRD